MRFFLVGALVICAAIAPARAQIIDDYFPVIPGLTPLSQTVLQRPHPAYEAPGLNAGAMVVRANLDSSVGYDSNVQGQPGGAGSPVISNAAGLSLQSDWGRDSLAAGVTVDDVRNVNIADQSYTNITASAGGVLDLGQDQASVGYAHLHLNQLPSQIDNLGIIAPLPYDVDDLRLSYSRMQGRFFLVPSLDLRSYQYGSARGVADQSYRDRIYLQPQLTAVYTLSPDRSLLFALRGEATEYAHTAAGGLNKGSNGGAVLVGIDFTADAVFRYRALIGYAIREFDSAAFRNQGALILEGTVIWTPTDLTTLTGSFERSIQDAAQEAISGYVYSGARVDIDHEVRRNIILSINAGVQAAQYQQKIQNQTLLAAGASLTWWLNRNVRLGVSYGFTSQIAGEQPGYNQSTVLATLGFSL